MSEKSDWDLLKPPGVKPDDDHLDQVYEASLLQERSRIRDYPYVMQGCWMGPFPMRRSQRSLFVSTRWGRSCGGSDLALAQITARWRNSLALFEEFSEECEAESQFTVDTGLLVRAIVVFATGQCLFRASSTTSLSSGLQEGLEEAKQGLRYALSFIRANAGVEDESLLSSPFLVLLPAYYGFKKGERLSEAEGKELLRWFYIAHARGHYSRGSSEGLLNADLALVRAGRRLHV